MLRFRANWVIILLPFALWGISRLTDFDGLYGQDAHEYLRQSKVFFLRMNGGATPPVEPGDYEFGAGYPLLGALFQFWSPDPVSALQWANWFSAAAGLFFFIRLNRLLLPGAPQRSHLLFALLLIFTPVWMRSALSDMSDMTAIAAVLGSLYFLLIATERPTALYIIAAGGWAGWAAATRLAIVPLLAPMAIWAGLLLLRRKYFGLVVLFLAALFAGWWPHEWARQPLQGHWGGSSLGTHWSFQHFLMRDMSGPSGSSHYFLPNIAYILSPLLHIGFCVLLPALFFLFRKTDLYLPEKKAILAGVILYLLLLGGLPVQSIRYLLPVWTTGLLLLFPAWDRFVCYGFYFTRKYTTLILSLIVLTQLVGMGIYLPPLIQRNHQERRIAGKVAQHVPEQIPIYAIDWDVALRSRLTRHHLVNLWVTRYDHFPDTCFFLFSEKNINGQWQNMNPQFNVNLAKETGRMIWVDSLEKDWCLYSRTP